MSEEFLELLIPVPRFGSDLDERAFFEWIKAIDGVETIKGLGRCIQLSIKHQRFDDNAMRRMISLYYRYNINFETLRVLINKDNEEWIMRPSTYWADRLADKRE
jgi:hypothetical protein